ncbi:MAG: hypothetical protein KAT90_13565, partial [Gammaproteobacteria bacterium]|nr:hypothetical protein [Gammaproteobacteria bacterium]
GGCSSSDDTATPITSSADTTTQKAPAENQFMKAQIETLNQAKDASAAANEAIIKRQQALEAAGQ